MYRSMQAYVILRSEGLSREDAIFLISYAKEAGPAVWTNAGHTVTVTYDGMYHIS
jgi:hypothetical protein